MKYSKIEEIRNSKKISQNDLANKIGMTRENYGRMIKKHTMKVENLEKIAEVLEVPVTMFFEESTSWLANEPESTYRSIKDMDKPDLLNEMIHELRNQLKVKDDQLKFLQHLIEEKL